MKSTTEFDYVLPMAWRDVLTTGKHCDGGLIATVEQWLDEQGLKRPIAGAGIVFKGFPENEPSLKCPVWCRTYTFRK